MVALQVYCPPWEVRRVLNFRPMVDSLLFIITLPIVTSFMPLVTALPTESSHSTSGWTVRPSTTVTLQVSVSISPAMAEPVVVMVTTAAVKAVNGRKQYSDISICSFLSQ